jgi:hypothetical protein
MDSSIEAEAVNGFVALHGGLRNPRARLACASSKEAFEREPFPGSSSW